jgi:hypothetical protein
MKLRTVSLLVAVGVLTALAGLGAVSGEASGLRELQGLGIRAPDPQPGWAVANGAGPSAPAPADDLAPGLPATVENFSFPKVLRSYPTRDAGGAQIGTTTWRVVRGTGNCCENHLGVTQSGRLLDYGGAYINFSDNQGVTWQRVRPAEPLVGPEGTIVQAPGGDIVGITWDPYTGDRVLAFKMDGATKAWSYMYTPLHTPFYDREWIAVIPGPLTVAGQTVPYLTVIRGGFPAKDIWYYSLDGLHYIAASNKVLTQVASGEGVSEWLPTTPNPDADWTQPISSMGMAPINTGGALAWRVDTIDSVTGARWWAVEPGSLQWTRFRLGNGSELPSGRLVQDSRGWTHVVNVQGGTVTYNLSKDGGQSWTSTTTALPDGHNVEEWDFHANGALGVTAVGIHAHNSITERDQDLVVKYGTACGGPEHTRTYLVGLGDLNAGRGVGATIRFDFATMVILPDGKIATSMMDSLHTSPALAVEVSTALNQGYEPPPLSCGIPAP